MPEAMQNCSGSIQQIKICTYHFENFISFSENRHGVYLRRFSDLREKKNSERRGAMLFFSGVAGSSDYLFDRQEVNPASCHVVFDFNALPVLAKHFFRCPHSLRRGAEDRVQG
jgi:hypothetical protein